MIALDRVCKAYPTPAGHKVVLGGASAVFEAGHNYGVLGVNGAGKSTLIRMLAGSEMPDRGRIRHPWLVTAATPSNATLTATIVPRRDSRSKL